MENDEERCSDCSSIRVSSLPPVSWEHAHDCVKKAFGWRVTRDWGDGMVWLAPCLRHEDVSKRYIIKQKPEKREKSTHGHSSSSFWVGSITVDVD